MVEHAFQEFLSGEYGRYPVDRIGSEAVARDHENHDQPVLAIINRLSRADAVSLLCYLHGFARAGMDEWLRDRGKLPDAL